MAMKIFDDGDNDNDDDDSNDDAQMAKSIRG